MDVILFLIFAIIAVVSAVNVVVQTHPISSAISLIGVMASLAVLYLLLGAEFIAMAQIIVYAGAVMVLFVFVIMLLNAGAESKRGRSLMAQLLGMPLLIAFLALASYFIQGYGAVHHLPAAVRSHVGPDSHRHCGRRRTGAQGAAVMTGVPLAWYLILSAVLFSLGIAGFLFRKSVITIFMSIELMLNAVNLSFVAFSYQLKQVNGHIFTFFVMVVAAAEAAVGLAIILTVFKNRSTLNVDELNSMKN